MTMTTGRSGPGPGPRPRPGQVKGPPLSLIRQRQQPTRSPVPLSPPPSWLVLRCLPSVPRPCTYCNVSCTTSDLTAHQLTVSPPTQLHPLHLSRPPTAHKDYHRLVESYPTHSPFSLEHTDYLSPSTQPDRARRRPPASQGHSSTRPSLNLLSPFPTPRTTPVNRQHNCQNGEPTSQDRD